MLNHWDLPTVSWWLPIMKIPSITHKLKNFNEPYGRPQLEILLLFTSCTITSTSEHTTSLRDQKFKYANWRNCYFLDDFLFIGLHVCFISFGFNRKTVSNGTYLENYNKQALLTHWLVNTAWILDLITSFVTVKNNNNLLRTQDVIKHKRYKMANLNWKQKLLLKHSDVMVIKA